MGKLETVIEMAIALFITAVVFPIALITIQSATSNSTWNMTGITATMFVVLLPVLATIGVAIEFMPKLRGD